MEARPGRRSLSAVRHADHRQGRVPDIRAAAAQSRAPSNTFASRRSRVSKPSVKSGLALGELVLTQQYEAVASVQLRVPRTFAGCGHRLLSFTNGGERFV